MKFVRRIAKAKQATKRRVDFGRPKSRVRAALIRRDGLKCCWCGKTMNPNTNYLPDSATIEHVRPLCRGGSNKMHNLKLACLSCNTSRLNLK